MGEDLKGFLFTFGGIAVICLLALAAYFLADIAGNKAAYEWLALSFILVVFGGVQWQSGAYREMPWPIRIAAVIVALVIFGRTAYLFMS